MPAGITSSDSMFSVREVPWHGQGAVLDEPPTDIADALKKSGLDWRVVQRPVHFERGGELVPFAYANEDGTVPDQPCAFVNVRDDIETPLGVVTNRYRVLQNVEAFQFLGNLIGSEMNFETAGSLHGGKQVWVMATLPDHIEVGGDAVKVYIFVTNSHDGFRAVKAAVSPTRIVCQNTLTVALNDAPRVYSVAHVGDPTAQLHEARRVLEVSVNYSKQFKELGDKLASQQITEKAFRKVLNELYPEDNTGMTDRRKQNMVDAKNSIVWLWKEGPTVGNAPGSKWSAANAVCEFVDYGTAVEHNGKLNRAMNDPSGLKKRAFELVAA